MSNKKSQIILYHAKSEDIEKGVLKFIMDSAPYAFRRQLVLVGNPLFIHYRTLCGFTSHYWKEIFKKDKDRFCMNVRSQGNIRLKISLTEPKHALVTTIIDILAISLWKKR